MHRRDNPTSAGPTPHSHGQSTHWVLGGALGYRPPATARTRLGTHLPIPPDGRHGQWAHWPSAATLLSRHPHKPRGQGYPTWGPRPGCIRVSPGHSLPAIAPRGMLRCIVDALVPLFVFFLRLSPCLLLSPYAPFGAAVPALRALLASASSSVVRSPRRASFLCFLSILGRPSHRCGLIPCYLSPARLLLAPCAVWGCPSPRPLVPVALLRPAPRGALACLL